MSLLVCGIRHLRQSPYTASRNCAASSSAHPHSFKIVTRVAVTDRDRSRIPLGSAYYRCDNPQNPGTSCTDQVAWRGKIILTYNGVPRS